MSTLGEQYTLKKITKTWGKSILRSHFFESVFKTFIVLIAMNQKQSEFPRLLQGWTRREGTKASYPLRRVQRAKNYLWSIMRPAHTAKSNFVNGIIIREVIAIGRLRENLPQTQFNRNACTDWSKQNYFSASRLLKLVIRNKRQASETNRSRFLEKII